jgi:site-specific DNA-methyltransferase (adenine-specific)
MEPSIYYEADGIQLWHGRWEEVWPLLGLAHEQVDLLWVDPPYGIDYRTSSSRSSATASYDWAPIVGDNKPFDPGALLKFPRSALWGANHYASRLPDSPSWWVWDKRDGVLENDNSDAELAWTNLGGPLRTCHHLWAGMVKASEREERRMHPTQKPVALASWGFQRAKLQRGQLVFSPYLGSGPALDMGLRLIGCEVEEQYLKACVGRLRQRPLL